MSTENPTQTVNPQETVETNSFPVELNSYSNTMVLYEFLQTGVTLEQLKLYCKNPMTYNKQLRRISREAYSFNGMFAKTCDYITSSMSLDSVTICTNNTSTNQNRRKKFNALLYKINHKLTTRDIILKLLIDGMYVGLLRDTKPKDVPFNDYSINFTSEQKLDALTTDGNLMIQPLNLDYCQFLGFQNNDYVVGFDMQYFDSFIGNGLTREIQNYPSEFFKAYQAYKKDAGNRWFKLDQSTTVALKFKANIDEPYGRPLSVSALNDIYFDEQYTDGQRETVGQVASTVRWLRQPMGEKQGQCALNKEAQQNQYDNFKNAIFKTAARDGSIAKTTIVALAPGTEVGKMDTDNSLLKDTLTKENSTKIATGLGFASSALNGESGSNYSSAKLNLDLVLSQAYQILEQVQWQYTKVLNNLLKIDFMNLIKFVYLKTSNINKSDEFTIAKDMYSLMSGSRIWAYAIGSGDVETYMDLMEYEKSENFDEKYPPHLTSFTASDSADKPNPGGNIGGRPEDKTSTNPETLKTKTSNSNKQPKPSTK